MVFFPCAASNGTAESFAKIRNVINCFMAFCNLLFRCFIALFLGAKPSAVPFVMRCAKISYIAFSGSGLFCIEFYFDAIKEHRRKRPLILICVIL